jgi:hypothetical protein
MFSKWGCLQLARCFLLLKALMASLCRILRIIGGVLNSCSFSLLSSSTLLLSLHLSWTEDFPPHLQLHNYVSNCRTWWAFFTQFSYCFMEVRSLDWTVGHLRHTLHPPLYEKYCTGMYGIEELKHCTSGGLNKSVSQARLNRSRTLLPVETCAKVADVFLTPFLLLLIFLLIYNLLNHTVSNK